MAATYQTIHNVTAHPGSLFSYPDKIVLREEQQEAVKKAKAMFGTTPRGGVYTVDEDSKKYLWNAKMRFGKTLCALQLVKEMGIQRVLIVTHRPVVNEEWFKNYKLIFRDTANYDYGTKSEKDEHGNFTDLEKFVSKPDNHYIFFASMQFLRRSTLVGGDNDGWLKKRLLENDWDMVIVDEAHEGTRTALGQRVIDLLKKKKTKMLHLSGTPFNLYDDFDPSKEVFTWDYIQEQQAKLEWPKKHPNEPNPYEELPKMKILTFNLGNMLQDFIDEGASFKFTEFFRTLAGEDVPKEKRGRFVHEEAVKQFLDKLCEDSATSNYPFSRDTFRDTFNHTLWIVPGVKEARALRQLLLEHEVFGTFGEDGIINVAGSRTEDEEREDALERVQNAIGAQPENTYTITISCGRLTTGVTVPEWTAVFYMKGSEMTSAATYMQTIFRVQSPWVIRDEQKNPIKMKRECYVFDFAPDRSLKMVAETAKFSSQAKKTAKKNADGEILTQEERDKETMKEFLKLCPVVSLEDGQLREYDANRLFKQLESVYIDRLVTSGFNDNCLYNPDELMAMDSEELNELGKKIAQSSNMEKPKNATPNDALQMNHLTEEERQRLEEAKRKARENRKNKKDPYEGLTQEEIDAIEAEKERKKKEREEREKRITNIRGISLRIPLLMYGGADAGDPNEPLTVENFTRKIKDESWEEFMPRGITKKDFNYIRRVFNATRFEEAGKRYRALALEADSMNVEDRIRRIADIFACFHNPDKETVLTPWRVVNMHMSDTLGGYCFFNEKFDGPCEEKVYDADGNVVDIIETTAPRYVEQGEVTTEVFENNQARILEINSKTGLYPLYVAYSLYRRRMKDFYDAELIEEHSVEEEQVVWDDIVQNNIFVICNTPMAARITRRTLLGFREEQKGNIKAVNLIERATSDRNGFVETIKSVGFWRGNTSKQQMEFSAIVGNPPYQLMGGSGGTNDSPIYQYFCQMAKNIRPNYVALIIPSRWFAAGRDNLLGDFRRQMLKEGGLRKLVTATDSKYFFPSVEIKGGCCYYLAESNYQGECEYHMIQGKANVASMLDLKQFDILIRDPQIANIVQKVLDRCEDDAQMVDSIISSDTPFGIPTKPTNNKKQRFEISNERTSEKQVMLFYIEKLKRQVAFISEGSIIKNKADIHKIKVFIPEVGGSGNDSKVLGVPVFAPSPSVCSQSYLYVAFDSEEEAHNFIKYIRTKFLRVLVSARKITQHATNRVYSYVPILNFRNDSEINWNAPIPEIDRQLYSKYDLDIFERDYIESMIKPMD